MGMGCEECNDCIEKNFNVVISEKRCELGLLHRSVLLIDLLKT